jgi:hypothetical protein
MKGDSSFMAIYIAHRGSYYLLLALAMTKSNVRSKLSVRGTLIL